MHKALLLGSLLLVSCLRDTSYRCTTNVDCGTDGTCVTSVGYCSIADTNCASGARFGSSAGSYANQCVGDQAPTDAPSGDSPAIDAAPDAVVTGCPAPYVTMIGGNANHLYRLVSMTDDWQGQRAFCLSTTSSGYLAIPDDLVELQALATLSAATEAWVGISDTATENTFVTVKGVAQTFLPWDTGQPDDSGPGEDCVVIRASSSSLRDERCSSKLRAVCECAPL